MGLILGTLFSQDFSFQENLNLVYQNNIEYLDGKNADLMVPVFIIHYLPNGVIGILIVFYFVCSNVIFKFNYQLSFCSIHGRLLLKIFQKFRMKNMFKVLVFFLFWGLTCLPIFSLFCR